MATPNNPEDVFARLVDEGPVDQDKLLKDDEILTEEDKEKVKPEKNCVEAKPKKPCANCTCGLADVKDQPVTETPKASCGSCYLGDAFRCASCPYRGMPAFKPGEKVVLDTSDLD